MLYNLFWILLTIVCLALTLKWLIGIDANISFYEESPSSYLDLDPIVPVDDSQIANRKPDYEKIFDRMYDGLKWVESTNNPTTIGDDGAAIGILQIRNSYWIDAAEQNPQLRKHTHQYCFDQWYSKDVMRAYMIRQINHWNKYTGDWLIEEELVRIHNGGPNGHLERSTLEYLDKYIRYRKILDAGFQPIKGSSLFVLTDHLKGYGLAVGATVTENFFD